MFNGQKISGAGKQRAAILSCTDPECQDTIKRTDCIYKYKYISHAGTAVSFFIRAEYYAEAGDGVGGGQSSGRRG